MSWGIIIKDVALPGVTKDDIQNALDDTEYTIQMLREQIMMYAASTPQVPKDDDDAIPSLNFTMRALLQDYEDYVAKRELLSKAAADLDNVKNY